MLTSTKGLVSAMTGLVSAMGLSSLGLQVLTLLALLVSGAPGTHFTCFTSTSSLGLQVLSLIALLVQNQYKSANTKKQVGSQTEAASYAA